MTEGFKRPSSAPRPKPQQVDLMNAVFEAGRAAEPLRNDRGQWMVLIESIDALVASLNGFDQMAFPPGFVRRLNAARAEINMGSFGDGRALLEMLRRDVEKYWAN